MSSTRFAFRFAAVTTTLTALVGLSASGAGCESETGADGTGDAGIAADASGSASVRGNRYCEVLLAFVRDGSVDAQVWGTQGLNDCPPEAWAAVDVAAIRAESGATFVVLNGPRHWTLDAVKGELPAGAPRLFGTLQMQQLATVSLAPGVVSQSAYVERTVLRNAEFEFFAGTEIYELVAPNDVTYVMQSYARIVEPALTASDLPGLGARLTLPAGWKYRARKLESALRVRTPGQATVVQDDLQNSYSRYTPER